MQEEIRLYLKIKYVTKIYLIVTSVRGDSAIGICW